MNRLLLIGYSCVALLMLIGVSLFAVHQAWSANTSEHRAIAFQAAYEGLARSVSGKIDNHYVCKVKR